MCSNSKRRLLSNLMASNCNSADIVSGDKFYVKGNTGDFNDRQRDIFGRLSSLEEKHIEVQKETVPDEPEDKTENEIEAHDFTVPQRPPIRRKPPFYSRNGPNTARRWTEYSLADVSSDQMSDKSNTSAALSFLTERKRKRDDDEGDDEDDMADDSDGSIKFTKPKSKGEESDESDSSKVEFRSGKWKMPEYVIGQEKKNTRKTDTDPKKGLSCNKIQLGHLQDEVDSDDDDTEEKEEKSFSKSRKNLRKREENE